MMKRLWRLLVLHFTRRDLTPLEHLERALLLMPRLDREIFLAFRLDRMSYDEIADHTGLSVAQVEEAIIRAISDIDRHVPTIPTE